MKKSNPPIDWATTVRAVVPSALLAVAVAGSLSACFHPERDATVPKLWAPSPAARIGLDAPRELATPAGNQAAFAFSASGVQKYQCRRADGGFAWAFVGPEAKLYNSDDKLVGKHYGGPTWEYQDGSKITGSVISHTASKSPQSVDELLLRAKDHLGEGIFSQVTFIQRLRTYGGAPPKDACDAGGVGREVAVEYSAQYVFYTPQ